MQPRLAQVPAVGGRLLRTTDLDALALAQPDKNRRYVQLQPGLAAAELHDVRLGSVQVFRERLGTGMLVEAAPAPHLVPFGIILSARGDPRFCGADLRSTHLAQASGGVWDIRFEGPLDYVSLVFARPWFEREAEALLGHPPPDDWFRSRARLAEPKALRALGVMIAGALERAKREPAWLEESAIRPRLQSEILRMSVTVLTSADGGLAPVARYGRRWRGVRRALEYLRDQPRADANLATLCRIAGVSERTLEYGFSEHLGMTPQRFVKLLRLNGARRELRYPSHDATTVTDVALAWGFSELGRFAGEYRRHFGELPSQTLRRT